jgi:hypothetical protein
MTIKPKKKCDIQREGMQAKWITAVTTMNTNSLTMTEQRFSYYETKRN